MTLRSDRPGIALLVVMLLTMVVAAIAAGAALIGANSFLINEYDTRRSLLESAADAGLELARARLNARPDLYSDSVPVPLEYDATVYDVRGDPIPGVSRTVYAMPLGGGFGELGNFAALVAIAEDAEGTRVVRRLDLIQKSFATYGYFTDYEPNGMEFGSGDQLFGPVHSNSSIAIDPTGATFHGPVTTAGEIAGAGAATFLDDTTSQVTPIAMPTQADLERLRRRAAESGYVFTAAPVGTAGQATLRIEFVARDVDLDGVEEGFLRAYRSADPAWVTGHPRRQLTVTPNCGHYEADGAFHPAAADPLPGHDAATVLTSATRRCFLGGADELNATAADPGGVFQPTDSLGAWLAYPGSVAPAVSASQPDAGYLYPIDRRINPDFRGLVFVDGEVAVSGTVRGRLTVAATGGIIVADDIEYETDPGAGTCRDILGLFSGGDVVVANNALNAPWRPARRTGYLTFDDTPDETVDASILALSQFAVEDPGVGSEDAEPCNGTAWGRGCLQVTGGLVQRTRGTIDGGGPGHIERYSHDLCTFTAPPPYFPSVGHFWRGRYHEVDPTGFTIGAYFEALN